MPKVTISACIRRKKAVCYLIHWSSFSGGPKCLYKSWWWYIQNQKFTKLWTNCKTDITVLCYLCGQIIVFLVCVCVCVCLLSKWAKRTGSRLVQIRHWDSLGLQRAEIWYTCKKQPNPTGVLLQVKFLFPSQILFFSTIVQRYMSVNYTWRRSNDYGVVGCGVVGETWICEWCRQKVFPEITWID